MSLEFIRENKKLVFGIFLAFVLFLALAIFFISLKNRPVYSTVDYVIPNVSFGGAHNQTGEFASLNTETPVAVYSILKYWNKEADPRQVSSFFATMKLKDKNTIVSFFDRNYKDKLKIQKVDLEIGDIKKYINPDVRTPLLVTTVMNLEQPEEVRYYPVKVLIGYSDTKKTLTFHDFWLGNNYEVSFDDFKKMQEMSGLNKDFLLVQPNDLKGKLKEIKSKEEKAYPTRTEVMKKTEKIMQSYAIGRWADYTKSDEIAESYLLKTVNDSNFEAYFPPYFRMKTYGYLTNTFNRENKYDEAMNYVNKAIALNHDLNKPFLDWPGYEISGNTLGDKSANCSPYYLLADTYRDMGELEKSKTNYRRAQEICPDNQYVKKSLQNF
jgi:tetratricopeptide (TPR) repeat protein